MNRDKQIEEMAKFYDEILVDILVDKPTEVTHQALNWATNLYDKGYRKASDVVRDIEALARQCADEAKLLRDKEHDKVRKADLNGEYTGALLVLNRIIKLKKKYESEEER